MNFKLSELEKHDMVKVRKTMQNQQKKKSLFNSNGYKTITVVVFGDQAPTCQKLLKPGTVIAVLNPKEMTGKPD